MEIKTPGFLAPNRRIPHPLWESADGARAAAALIVVAMKSLETDVETAVDRVFSVYPELAGFSVQEAGSVPRDREAGQLERTLCLADLGVLPGGAGPDEIFGGVAVMLLDLIDERPEARELLRGRTFARTLH